MRARLNQKDFIAGLVFVFFGIGAVWLSQKYPMGTPTRMGPAYFPSVIGGALAILGFVIALRALWSGSEPVHVPRLRPILSISAAGVIFALFVKPLGLVLTLLILVLISCLGGAQYRLREVAVLYLLLTIISISLFVYGLGLQFSVWPS